MKISPVDFLVYAIIVVLLIGLVAPRFVLPRRYACRKSAGGLFGAILATLLLYSGLGKAGLIIAMIPVGIAWMILRSSRARQLLEPGPGDEGSDAAGMSVNSVGASPASESKFSSLSSDPERTLPVSRGPSSEQSGKQRGSAMWIPPGQPVRIDSTDIDIPNAMLYVGTELPAIRAWGGAEPSLINPCLNIQGNAEETPALGYWPSYSDIDPAARALYLRWLAGGRRGPVGDVGYVFLFYYGLERRLLHDRVLFQESAEREAILNEIRSLLDQYGENRSFRGYAGELLSLARLVMNPNVADLPDAPPIDLLGDGDAIPVDLRVRLGSYSATGKPIPAGWALAWCLHDPNIRLRTPARRCMGEFQRLFRSRYVREFGDGLIVKPNKTPVAIAYRPASASFGGVVEAIQEPVVPDITVLAGPARRLSTLVEVCTSELEPYSRWLGRNPDARDDLAGAALLPPELLEAAAHEGIGKLAKWAEGRLGKQASVTIPAEDMIGQWAPEQPEALGKAACVGLCTMLDRLSFGIEPDVRFGGETLRARLPVVLFRNPIGSPSAPSPEYRGATVLLHLAALVAAADDSVSPEEERRLEKHLGEILHLAEAERLRLHCHLAWLLQAGPSMAGLKRRIAELSPDHCRSLAEFLIGIAGADGTISPEEIEVLQRIYPLLRLDPEDVFGHIHALTIGSEGGPGPAAEPVVVRSGSPRSGRRIPGPEEATPRRITRSEAIQLDSAKIQRKLAETAAVAALLGSVFVEDEPPPVTAASLPQAEVESGVQIPPLDGAHSMLLQRLAERPSWSRADLDALVEGLGLMTDGALETINDAAFEKTGGGIIDGEDPYEVDQDAWKEFVDDHR